MSLIPRFFDDLVYSPRMRNRDPFFSNFMDVDFYGRHHGVDRAVSDMIDDMEKSLDRVKCLDGGIVPRRNGDFEVALNVNGFSPEELKIDYKDGFLTMKGEHKEESPDGTRFVSRSFHRQYMLPKTVDDEKMKSVLSRDGNVLRIHAPAKEVAEAVEAPKEVPIAITRN